MIYAGFWIRFFAFCIDSLILLPAYLLQNLASAFVSVFYGYLIAFVAGWFYYSVFESSNWQATPGKKLLKIKVTSISGEKISFAKATGRYFSKFISSFIFGFGYVLIALTEKKQSLHDLIVNTLVLKSEIQNVNLKPVQSGQKSKTKSIVLAGFSNRGHVIRLSIDVNNSKLVESGLLIGRDSESCDLVVDDPSVSRRHARISRKNGNFFLEDLSSTNGTFHNNNKLEPNQQYLLDEEGIVTFGDIELSFGEY